MSEPSGSGTFLYSGHKKGEGVRMKMLDIYEKCDMFRRAEGGELAFDTVSLYITGMFLKEIFAPELSFSTTEEYSLEEVWFMICQCHDENTESWNIPEAAWPKITPLFHYSEGGIQYTNGSCIQSSMFTELQLKDFFYFQHICCADCNMDHGIAGGLLLYKSLIYNHLYNGKELDERVLNLYSYAANTMMAHNLCKKQGGWKKISFGEDPLLYMLLLAEVMEPLQYVRQGADYRRALQAVKVEVFQRKIVVYMNPEYFNMYELEKKMERLKKRIVICSEKTCKTEGFYICM